MKSSMLAWIAVFASVFASVSATPVQAEPEASKVQVTAQCNDMGMSYYGYTFDVSYPLDAVPPGTILELIHGFSGTGSINSAESMDKIQWHELKITPFDEKGHAQVQVYYMATGGYLSGFDFAIRWRTFASDSETEILGWDNGGSNPSIVPDHYRSIIFVPDQLECYHLQNARELQVSAVSEEAI